MQSLVHLVFLAFPYLIIFTVAASVKVHPSSNISSVTAQSNHSDIHEYKVVPQVQEVVTKPPLIPTLPPAPTPAPVTTTTAPPASTTAAPYQPQREFDAASFVGGIILCAGLTAIGFVSYKFYKTRVDPTYRTL